MSNFQPVKLGITAFLASDRVDFVLNGPEMDAPARVSAYYAEPKAELKLDGKKLTIGPATTNDAGEPQQLQIKWGRRVIKLGRRNNASGNVSFYRSLEAGNNVAGPKSANDILNALGSFTS